MDLDHDVVGSSRVYVVNIQLPDILQVEEKAPLEKRSFAVGQNRTIRCSGLRYTVSHHGHLLLQLYQLRF